MSSKAILEITDLTVKYDDKVVLDSCELVVLPGEIVVVLGASGDGKTTLLKSIAGLLPVSSGTMLFEGDKIKDPTEQLIPGHARIKLVNQDFGLDPYHTVEENLRLKLLAYDEGYRNERVSELLNVIELSAHRNQKATELSGGQKQRLAIARALADDPDLILLDEPFNQLDFQMKRAIGEHIRNYLKENNISAILVTHNGIEALEWADRIAYMHKGKIERIDTPERFYDYPKDQREGEFFGEMNKLIIGDRQIYFRPGNFRLDKADKFDHPLSVSFLSKKKLGWYNEFIFTCNTQEIRLFSTVDISDAGIIFIHPIEFID